MEGFTQQAEDALARARTEARLLRQHRVGTEHLLLGLLGAPGKAAIALASFGVDQAAALDRVRMLAAGAGVGAGAARPSEMGFTPSLKRVMEHAKQEAAHLHADRVDTHHLLLAVIRENRSGAMRVLHQLGVDDLELRRRLLQGTTPADPRSPGPLAPNNPAAWKIAARDREIDRLARILVRRHDPHALVLGAPGVGKTALVQGLFWEATEGRLSDLQLGRRPVRWLRPDLTGADRAAAANPAEVVIVDDAHLAPDLSGLLTWTAGLRGPAVVVLRSTAATGLDARVKALTERFGVVELLEPDRDAAIIMVRAACQELQRHHRLAFTDAAVVHAVEAGGTMPDSAVRLLDDAAALAVVHGEVSLIDVAQVKAALADPTMDGGEERTEARRRGLRGVRGVEGSVAGVADGYGVAAPMPWRAAE
ncbi:MAG: ATP-dependent Clp protease ATP-binding subunit [Catenulispora sp.]|nr:ATP-dependent Clp protease ATP-binding subunit [Catenulispora sp.]